MKQATEPVEVGERHVLGDAEERENALLFAFLRQICENASNIGSDSHLVQSRFPTRCFPEGITAWPRRLIQLPSFLQVSL